MPKRYKDKAIAEFVKARDEAITAMHDVTALWNTRKAVNEEDEDEQ